MKHIAAILTLLAAMSGVAQGSYGLGIDARTTLIHNPTVPHNDLAL